MNYSQQLEPSLEKRTELICTPNIYIYIYIYIYVYTNIYIFMYIHKYRQFLVINILLIIAKIAKCDRGLYESV